jgi:hypothetical protein
METPIRVFDPKLVTNINGSATLTFSIYYRYYDEETESFYNHPYIKYLTNERKIKLRHGALGDPGTKWYDLIIKNIQEDSNNKTFTYTAKDIFINELSKSGFNLVFDPELENNIGDIGTLADRVLEGSDWIRSSADKLAETTQEPLYKVRLGKSIKAKRVDNDGEEITILANDFLYAFYSVITNEEPYF